jgi:hypothetical protein
MLAPPYYYYYLSNGMDLMVGGWNGRCVGVGGIRSRCAVHIRIVL